MRKTVGCPPPSAQTSFGRSSLAVVAAGVVFWAASGGCPAAADETPEAKRYVGHSRAACETIDYVCPAGIETFQDEAGCGCLFPTDKPDGHAREKPIETSPPAGPRTRMPDGRMAAVSRGCSPSERY
jgi:hypothetical protein